MNAELLHLYQQTNEAQRRQLKQVFSDSPKTLRLVAFLEQQKTDDFKTPKAVNFIYQEELADTAHKVLVNRFYKLRQSLREWILEQTQPTDSVFLPEEQELGQLRLLVTKNEYGFALPRLQQLQQRCDEQAIYELLPEVLQLTLRCIQSSDSANLALQESYENQLITAAERLRALQWMQYYYRRSFREQSPNRYPKELIAEIRKIYERDRESIRFAKIYHYIAFARGAFFFEHVARSGNALQRHLNSFWELQAAHPKVPVLYVEMHHAERAAFDIYLVQASFDFMRGKWASAAQAIAQRQALRGQAPHIYPRMPEAEYRNSITVYLVNQQYDQALQVYEELAEFYEQNNANESARHTLAIDFTNICVFAYPQRSILSGKEAAAHLAAVEAAESVLTGHYQWAVRVAKALFLVIQRRYVAAQTILEQTEIQTMLRSMGIEPDFFVRLCRAAHQQDRSELEAIQKSVLTELKRPAMAFAKAYYEWLGRLLGRITGGGE